MVYGRLSTPRGRLFMHIDPVRGAPQPKILNTCQISHPWFDNLNVIVKDVRGKPIMFSKEFCMKKSALFLAMSLALGLSACGGGGGDTATPTPAPTPTPTPTPTTDVCTNVPGVQTTVPPGYFAQGTTCTLTDACVNYEGLQTELELTQKAFVRDVSTGTCKLEKNHAALASSGFDIARMQGHTGKDVVIYVADDGFYPAHQEFTGRIAGSV